MIRIVLAEDHHLVRKGILALLEKAGDVEVVGEAADGYQAVELAQRLIPDVVVMDIAMPRLSGIQAAEQIHALKLGIEVVVLSMYGEETLVHQALRSGVKGYVLKNSVAEELMLAVRAASRGEVYLSPAVSGPLVQDLLELKAQGQEKTPFERLTRREREVLQLIAEGHTNAAIAHLLHLSVKTVEKHRGSLMAKLDVHDVAGLVRVAIKHGLVFLDS